MSCFVVRQVWLKDPTSEKKQTLIIRADDFIRGSPDNDWGRVVNSFMEQIDEHTNQDAADKASPNFLSSVTNDEGIACAITIMKMSSAYFDFGVISACGFPSITLEGSLQDWTELHARAVTLVRENCLESMATTWLPALEPVLLEFVVLKLKKRNRSKLEYQIHQGIHR